MPGRGSARADGPGGSEGPDARSTAEVIASLVVNLQAMVAKEFELVGLELKRIVGRKVAAIALLLVGALTFASVLLLGAMTAAFALEGSFDERWMAWGAVTLATGVLALLLVGIAARLLTRRWAPSAGRRDATSTAAWLRSLTDELTGGPDTTDADTGDVEGRA